MDFSPSLEKIYQQEYKRAFIDELNNIYVALTRAKDEMYLFLPDKVAKSVNFVRALIPEEMVERGQPVSLRPPTAGLALAPEDGVVNIPASGYQDWIEILRDEFMLKEEILRRKNLRQGEIVHFILSRLGKITKENLERSVHAALEKTRLAFGDENVTAEYEKLVRCLLKDSKVNPFFVGADAEIFTEKEIVDSFGKTRRVDRLLIFEKEVFVVDYKSSADDQESYRKQVAEYMKLLRPLYPRHRVRGFLIYLDEIKVEEVQL